MGPTSLQPPRSAAWAKPNKATVALAANGADKTDQNHPAGQKRIAAASPPTLPITVRTIGMKAAPHTSPAISEL
jgi:hypothetical protein